MRSLLISLILLSEISVLLPSIHFFQRSYGENPLCIDFIPLNATIRLTCGSATLTDIYEAIEEYRAALTGFGNIVIDKESDDGIWLLKSNLVIGSNSSFTIDSTDSK